MEKLFTPEDVACILKVKRRTIYLWLRAGKIPAVKVGTLWRIKESDLQDFINSRTTNRRESRNGKKE